MSDNIQTTMLGACPQALSGVGKKSSSGHSRRVIKKGDIYRLGRHIVMCGDSTDETDVIKLTGGRMVDMVFADPPYGMKKGADGVTNDNLNAEELIEFNKQWAKISFERLKPLGSWYCWGIDEALADIYSHILKPMKRSGQAVIRNYITWAKHTAQGVGSPHMLSYPRETEKAWFAVKGRCWGKGVVEDFPPAYEELLRYLRGEADKVRLTDRDIKRACGAGNKRHWFTRSQFYVIPEGRYKKLQEAYPTAFKKTYDELLALIDTDKRTRAPRPYFNNTYTDSAGGIGLTDVWRFAPAGREEREAAGGHPTVKPLSLCERAINASTRAGESVFDPFGGSGSVLIACERTGRTSYTMECDPRWVEVIIARWEKATGCQAGMLDV